MTCEQHTFVADEAVACGPAPSLDGNRFLPSTTTDGDAMPSTTTDGHGCRSDAATSMGATGVLLTAGRWIASQRAFLAAILVQQEARRGSMANQLDPHGEDACRQLTTLGLSGCSLRTARGSSPTGQPYGEPCESEDMIPEMERLMPTRSELRTAALDGLCSRTGPTLTVHGNYNRKGLSATSGDGLATWCKATLPTLTRSDGTGGPGHSGRQGGMNLQTAVRTLPTLCATDDKSPYSAEGYRRHVAKRSKPLRDTAAHTIGIRLTPDFCEWWMGWPIGASVFLRSGTPGFPSKPLPHGACLEDQQTQQANAGAN